MSRKAVFSSGGGFLNNVDGKIVGYEFTVDPPFANPGGYVYLTIKALVDGKEGVDESSLFFGDGESFTIAEGGQSVTPIDGAKMGGTTPVAKFIGSLDATEHEGSLSDDEDVIDFTPIVGARVRFVQEPLSEEEIKKLKAKGKKTTREGQNGKQYPLTNLVVGAFYGMEAVKAAKGAKGAKATGPKPVDVAALSGDVIRTVLAAQPKGAIALGKVSTKVLQEMLTRPEKAQKEAVRQFLANEDSYGDDGNAIAGVSYNKKTETISLD